MKRLLWFLLWFTAVTLFGTWMSIAWQRPSVARYQVIVFGDGTTFVFDSATGNSRQVKGPDQPAPAPPAAPDSCPQPCPNSSKEF